MESSSLVPSQKLLFPLTIRTGNLCFSQTSNTPLTSPFPRLFHQSPKLSCKAGSRIRRYPDAMVTGVIVIPAATLLRTCAHLSARSLRHTGNDDVADSDSDSTSPTMACLNRVRGIVEIYLQSSSAVVVEFILIIVSDNLIGKV